MMKNYFFTEPKPKLHAHRPMGVAGSSSRMRDRLKRATVAFVTYKVVLWDDHGFFEFYFVILSFFSLFSCIGYILDRKFLGCGHKSSWDLQKQIKIENIKKASGVSGLLG